MHSWGGEEQSLNRRGSRQLVQEDPLSQGQMCSQFAFLKHPLGNPLKHVFLVLFPADAHLVGLGWSPEICILTNISEQHFDCTWRHFSLNCE